MKAVIAGASGLIGSQLLQELLVTRDYTEVVVLVRKPLELTHPKLVQKVVDFENLTQLAEAVPEGAVIFCCVGTTQNKVKGDKVAYRKVDYDIPVNVATIARQKKSEKYLLISSVGADPAAGNFYLQLKGETEKAISELNFPTLIILRPSLLLGKRSESRVGESIAQAVMGNLAFLFIGAVSKYRPVPAKEVAIGLLKASLQLTGGTHILFWKEIHSLATAK